MTLDELKTAAADVARALSGSDEPLPPDVRKRFIAVRTALIQRGVFDPLLIRFDSATVPTASLKEIGERLQTIAQTLSI